jgi:hypothetical protein
MRFLNPVLWESCVRLRFASESFSGRMEPVRQPIGRTDDVFVQTIAGVDGKIKDWIAFLLIFL